MKFQFLQLKITDKDGIVKIFDRSFNEITSTIQRENSYRTNSRVIQKIILPI